MKGQKDTLVGVEAIIINGHGAWNSYRDSGHSVLLAWNTWHEKWPWCNKLIDEKQVRNV